MRFECGAEDRMSKDYGPFDYLQFVYTTITSTDGVEIAYYDTVLGWRFVDDLGRVEKITGVAIDLDDAFRSWSDVVVWGAP
jgi:hypothetical protein